MGYELRDTGPELLVLKKKKSAGLAEMKKFPPIDSCSLSMSTKPDPEIQDKERDNFK